MGRGCAMHISKLTFHYNVVKYTGKLFKYNQPCTSCTKMSRSTRCRGYTVQKFVKPFILQCHVGQTCYKLTRGKMVIIQ